MTKHLQIYVQLKGRMYFNRIKSPFTRDAHIEKQHARQNIDAANNRKKGEWKEWGKMIYWKNFNHALHVWPFCSSLTHSLRILKSKVDGCLTVLKQSSLPLNQHPDDQILMLNNNTQIHGLLTEEELQMNMIQDANLWQELNALVPISKPSLNNTLCLNRKYIELISQLEIV